MKIWKDPKTDLEWQNVDSVRMPWNAATIHAESLGDDWRLPTIEELESLLDRSRHDPSIREEVPFRDSAYYWSSTIGVYNTSDAWLVYFNRGCVGSSCKTGIGYVRCVRGKL